MAWIFTDWRLIAGAVVALGLLAIATCVYTKGERAGAAGVTSKVQSETIRELDAARKQKERIDADVHRTPYDDRVDALR